MNITFAQKIISELANFGVDEYIVCPGARNAPFVVALQKARGVSTFHHFEERSASFFALGRIKTHGRAVAVVTTSGTAVAECFAAVIEAYYSGLPLVIISADRPERYRGSGAPQVIEQKNIFGIYADPTMDLSTFKKWKWKQNRTLHLNICFDEPLLSGEATFFKPEIKHRPVERVTYDSERLNAFKSQKPVVILGALSRAEKDMVIPELQRLKLPIYAEALSHCREAHQLDGYILHSGEKILSRLNADGVIRIGSVPTARFWRDLENSKLNVVSFSHLPFSGLSRDPLAPLPLEALKNLKTFNWTTTELQKVWDLDHKQSLKLDQLLKKYPRSEASFVSHLSGRLETNAKIYLGNSLPIRHWDLVSGFENRDLDYQANRGANGIDGQLSTFFGWCTKEEINYGLVGDLTALYDFASLWLTPTESQFHLIILNNHGGSIFKPMFKNAAFENRHKLNFSSWAEQFSLSYKKIEDVESLDHFAQINELCPDTISSEKFHEAWGKSWLKK